MNALAFITTYFSSWSITGYTMCGHEHGVIRLRSNETRLKVFVKLNGDAHWTGLNVTVDHVEDYEED